ncbi:DUF1858 domain-containing protein [Erysipelothrix sp. D19-032]
MKIRIDETFYNIVQKDPELRNILVEFGFKPMKHDLQFSTVGKVVTIRKGLKHLDKDVEALNKWLEEHGSVHRFIDETIATNDEHETESRTLGSLIKRLHEGENPRACQRRFSKALWRRTCFGNCRYGTRTCERRDANWRDSTPL